MLLSVDPGLRHCGCALWADKTLVAAELVRGPKSRTGPEQWRGMASAVVGWVSSKRVIPAQIAIEVPGAYGADRPSRTLDLQNLVGVAAWIWAIYNAEPILVRPREWKGTISAEACCVRAESRLAPEERAAIVFSAKSLQHNVWDSVGLGLWVVGRFAPVRK